MSAPTQSPEGSSELVETIFAIAGSFHQPIRPPVSGLIDMKDGEESVASFEVVQS